ncbi:MAG: ABC transporter ATP-binding protein [Treponema sp.]|jgi:zinc transport system ATP-binding protein|nr:ABC transporter ATP-binding protein [Treponema sp.]
MSAPPLTVTLQAENALISCKDAAFAYDGNIVVKNLTFTVAAGDYLCVVGENGSGKSTLMRGLLGLLPLAEGRITRGDALRAHEIGYLPQYKAAQKDFPASVYEVVLSGRQGGRGILPFYSKQDKAVADENLTRLNIADLRKSCYRELSGGQQQRVLLARALCASRRLLLLDEPASGLDPLITAELYRLVGQINRETGVAIIMVSHDIKGAVECAQRILHLRREQIFLGSAAEYRDSAIGKQFLGTDRSI